MNPDELQTALTLLPHGAEFRFVDKLTALEPGRSATGVYVLKENENFLKGHFPGEPMMPGVLLIEAVAQLAGIVAQTDPTNPGSGIMKLTAIRGAKILDTARPGDCVVLSVELEARLRNLVQARGTATVNGKTVLRTELTLAI